MTESFHDWLLEQAERQDDVGELAASVAKDPQFPAHGDKSIFEGWFTSASEPKHNAVAFERAWEEFEGKHVAP